MMQENIPHLTLGEGIVSHQPRVSPLLSLRQGCLREANPQGGGRSLRSVAMILPQLNKFILLFQPFEVFRAIERKDIMFLMEIRDRAFPVRPTPHGSSLR